MLQTHRGRGVVPEDAVVHLDRAFLVIEGAASFRDVILKGAVVDSHCAVTKDVDARAKLFTRGRENRAGSQSQGRASHASQVFEKRRDATPFW